MVPCCLSQPTYRLFTKASSATGLTDYVVILAASVVPWLVKRSDSFNLVVAVKIIDKVSENLRVSAGAEGMAFREISLGISIAGLTFGQADDRCSLNITTELQTRHLPRKGNYYGGTVCRAIMRHWLHEIR